MKCLKCFPQELIWAWSKDENQKMWAELAAQKIDEVLGTLGRDKSWLCGLCQNLYGFKIQLQD